MFNGSPTSGPNFYYAARNTQNANNQQNNQRYEQDVYSSVPAKRAAYGQDEPVSDCQQTEQCEDLSHLAPYVPEDDMFELNQWEDLDLNVSFNIPFELRLKSNCLEPVFKL